MANIYLKLFVDCLDKYQKLNDSEFGRLVRAALRYKATGEEPVDLGREALLWDGMRLDIDRDAERYSETVSKRAEAGKKGAEARWQKDGKNSKCHLPYGKNGKDKEKDTDKEKEYISPLNPPRGKFTPPTLEAVAEYCKERKNSVDPQKFVDWYTANGWKVGKNPMKDWKAAVRTWEKKEAEYGSNRGNHIQDKKQGFCVGTDL